MQAKLLAGISRAAPPIPVSGRTALTWCSPAAPILEAIRRRWPSPRMRVADRGLRRRPLDRHDGGRRRLAAPSKPPRPARKVGNNDQGTDRGTGPAASSASASRRRSSKASSRQWLQRHINDPYVQRAQLEGYRVRAAFKLLEIDERAQYPRRRPPHHRPISRRTGQPVADRRQGDGLRPTRMSWRRGHRLSGKRRRFPARKILQRDFLDPDAPTKLMEAVGGTPDLVMSDMAAPTTGHHRTDHLRTMHLCEVAAHFAVLDVLGEGGHFLAEEPSQGARSGRQLLNMLKQLFPVRWCTSNRLPRVPSRSRCSCWRRAFQKGRRAGHGRGGSLDLLASSVAL